MLALQLWDLLQIATKQDRSSLKSAEEARDYGQWAPEGLNSLLVLFFSNSSQARVPVSDVEALSAALLLRARERASRLAPRAALQCAARRTLQPNYAFR